MDSVFPQAALQSPQQTFMGFHLGQPAIGELCSVTEVNSRDQIWASLREAFENAHHSPLLDKKLIDKSDCCYGRRHLRAVLLR